MSAVCAVCLLLCNFHRSVFTALLPALAGAGGGGLALSGGEVGLLQGAMLVGYLAGQLPAGEASDREGGDRWAGGRAGGLDAWVCQHGDPGDSRCCWRNGPGWASLPYIGNGLVVATGKHFTGYRAALRLHVAIQASLVLYVQVSAYP